MEKIPCPHCGTMNDVGRSLCSNCQSPLTAYGGQLKGEAYKGKLAAQVEQLKERPPAVPAMVLYLIFIALGWPLKTIVMVFLHRVQTNAEGTNYVASALGSIAPLFVTLLCLPLAFLLVWLAWAVWNQRESAWKFSLGAVIIFAVYTLIKYADYRNWTLLWVGLSIVLIVLWVQPRTKGWFGMF